MKVPVICFLAALFLSSCVSPTNERDQTSDEQGEWNSKLPDNFFDEQEESSQGGVTNLRDPDQKDPLTAKKKREAKFFPEYNVNYNFLRADRTLACASAGST